MTAAFDRLAPEHYEPVRLPPEMSAYSSVPRTLRPGAPAKVGILDLAYARRGERTELVRRYQKSPLQIMRPLYVDPALPGMAFTYVMATGGGIAQADRYRQDLRCGPGTQALFTTQAATKVYRMEDDYAAQRVHLTVEEGAYVEYLPDPVIPFRGARFHQGVELTVSEGATVVYAETFTAGRLARGERHAYTVVTNDLEIRRPDGTPLAVDTLRLRPRSPGGVAGPGVFAGHDHVATLHVITSARPAADVADALHGAVTSSGVIHGASVLPGDCGAWMRILGREQPRVADAVRAGWDAVRRLLIGHPAPDLRKP
ncbi:urease accessory protein UreD [Streptomyces daghestanicus]|uniref:Urease accessory protein UreD n=1 Tax=Streptomyces daghestanicus TaxID=66885 RepID=A0ABQ3QCZ1_9ACTN|nr:urease accessory protein UreD [Streptomyces daghestanicus]GGU14742.1 urease accessory protein UreD [Streptomyces daghestanicus]GHI35097.1 urease accessory protein UreD [Streptomyces daghestanicus]